jgi:hypothetical protein
MLVEDLGALVSVTELAERPAPRPELLEAATHAARILVLLHTRMAGLIPAEAVVGGWARAIRPFRGQTLLHCDFSPTNVFRDSDGGYVTLDGSPTFTATVSPLTLGRPEADLATFTVVLCWPLRPLHLQPHQLRSRLKMRRQFLSTYRDLAPRRVRWLVPYECILFVQSIWYRKILRRRNR